MESWCEECGSIAHGEKCPLYGVDLCAPIAQELVACKAQRDALLAACEALLTFDLGTIFAAAGGIPYSKSYTWSEFSAALYTAIDKAKGQ